MFVAMLNQAQAQTAPYNTQNAPSACSGAPVTNASGSASGLLAKTSQGSLCSLSVTNYTSTGGYVMVFNTTAIPADGAVTPIDCRPLAAGGVTTINWFPVPMYMSVGISVSVSSTGCLTKAVSAISGFISANIQ